MVRTTLQFQLKIYSRHFKYFELTVFKVILPSTQWMKTSNGISIINIIHFPQHAACLNVLVICNENYTTSRFPSISHNFYPLPLTIRLCYTTNVISYLCVDTKRKEKKGAHFERKSNGGNAVGFAVCFVLWSFRFVLSFYSIYFLVELLFYARIYVIFFLYWTLFAFGSTKKPVPEVKE